MKKSLYLAFYLGLVSFVCAFSLQFIDSIAKPIIAQNQQEVLEEALSSIYPNADVYKDETVNNQSTLSGYDLIDGFYIVEKDEEVVGYVYKLETKGRNGMIEFLLAVDPKTNVVYEIDYLSHSETPGRGDKIETPQFVEQIEGRLVDNIDIDTIAGATISSTAVKEAITQATNHFISEVGVF